MEDSSSKFSGQWCWRTFLAEKLKKRPASSECYDIWVFICFQRFIERSAFRISCGFAVLTKTHRFCERYKCASRLCLPNHHECAAYRLTQEAPFLELGFGWWTSDNLDNASPVSLSYANPEDVWSIGKGKTCQVMAILDEEGFKGLCTASKRSEKICQVCWDYWAVDFWPRYHRRRASTSTSSFHVWFIWNGHQSIDRPYQRWP
jgi:hypothetical protein